MEELNDHNSPGSLRPVLVMFYTLESVLNMCCLSFHISGLQAVDMDMFEWEEQAIHYFYLITFYVFMVLTLFQSINLWTGQKPSITLELVKTTAAAIVFVFISLTTMWDAERQFYLFDHDSDEELPNSVFIASAPVHPFFQYMRRQSITALTCGVTHMLHACLVLDFKLTSEKNDIDNLPIPLFVFGHYVHTWLEKFKWFREFSGKDAILI